MDSMWLLNLIRKLAYTGGTNDFNTRHNAAVVSINLMNLHQDRFQTIQDFQDQYLEMKKVCNVLELCFVSESVTVQKSKSLILR